MTPRKITTTVVSPWLPLLLLACAEPPEAWSDSGSSSAGDAEILGSEDDDRAASEPEGLAVSVPVRLSEAVETYLDELETARSNGDMERVRALRAEEPDVVPSPSEETVDVPEGGAAAADASATSIEKALVTPRFAGDTLVADTSTIDGRLDMVRAASGTYYAVVESMDNNALNIYRSLDGGVTWHHFYWFHGSNDLLTPAITVPEVTEDYLYLAYRNGTVLQLARIDLAARTHTFHTITSDSFGQVERPRLTTDDVDFPGAYYVYVAYTAAADNPCSRSPSVMRSSNRGQSWTNFHSLDCNAGATQVDIAYGGRTLYLTWEDRNGTPDVYVARNTVYGSSTGWESPVNLCASTTMPCEHPRVAATRGGREALVAYTKRYSTDTDVWYGYTLDRGVNWASNLALASNASANEERPAVAADLSLGSFHVAYWQDSTIRLRSAVRTTPTSWSSAQIVNDGTQASRTYLPAAVAGGTTSGQAGVAWSDYRTPTYGIYFDRADF